MTSKTQDIAVNAAKWIVAVVGLYFTMRIIIGWDSVNENVEDIYSSVSGAINLSIVAIAVCACIALVFGIISFIGNIKNSKGSIISLSAFLVMGLIAYLMADGSNVGGMYKAEESAIFWSDAGLIFTYVLGLVAIVAIVYSEVSKLFK